MENTSVLGVLFCFALVLSVILGFTFKNYSERIKLQHELSKNELKIKCIEKDGIWINEEDQCNSILTQNTLPEIWKNASLVYKLGGYETANKIVTCIESDGIYSNFIPDIHSTPSDNKPVRNIQNGECIPGISQLDLLSLIQNYKNHPEQKNTITTGDRLDSVTKL
jgi:hypothetical protein